MRACKSSGGRNTNHPGHVDCPDCIDCIDWIKKNQPNLSASAWALRR